MLSAHNPSSMPVLKKYKLTEFNNYAFAHIGDGFEVISDPDFCKFERKRFADPHGFSDVGLMIRVGTYFFHESRKTAWARATGLRVDYYYGSDTDPILAPVEHRHRWRVYFNDPFCYVSGVQSNGVNKSRQYGQVVTEVVISYLFFKKGYLAVVNNIQEVDMLSAFKHACVNFRPRKEQYLRQQQIHRQQINLNEKDQATARQNEHRQWAEEQLCDEIKQEELGDDIMPYNLSPCFSYLSTSSVEKIDHYAVLEQEKQALEEETQVLRVQLEDQKRQIQEHEAKMEEEQKKRKRSEVKLQKFKSLYSLEQLRSEGRASEIKEWKGKFNTLKRKVASLTEE